MAAVAGIELVVILAVALAFVSKPIATRMDDAATAKVLAPAKPVRVKPKPRKAAVAVPKLDRGETSVLVLNGNGRTGVAHAEAERVKGLGYVVAGATNAPRRDYTRSLIMYRPGYRPEALRLAKDTGIRIVSPLDGLKAAELMGAHVAVVLGA
jgi:hypothetical protein